MRRMLMLLLALPWCVLSAELPTVAVTAVRDSGVPERLRPKLEAQAARLELALSDHPGLQLLERDRLGLILEEQELTGRGSPLHSADRLLRLEFSPGSRAGEVELTLRLTDAAGKELARARLADCFSRTQEEERELLAQLLKDLPGVLPGLPDPRREAARHFAECQLLERTKEPKAALRRADAACALDPANEKYARVRLQLTGQLLGGVPRPARFAALSALLDRVEAHHRDFPKSTEAVFEPDWMNAFSFLFNDHVPVTPEERRQAAEVTARARAIHFEELSRAKWSHFDLSDGIGSEKEFERYSSVLRLARMGRLLYPDREAHIRGTVEAVEAQLDAAKDLADRSENPKALKVLIYPVWSVSADGAMRSIAGRALRLADGAIDKALNHPIPSIRHEGAAWELLQKTFNADFDPETFRSDYQRYCRRILDSGDTLKSMPRWPLLKSCRQYELIAIADEIGKEMFSFDDDFRFQELCRRVAAAKSPRERAETIIELAPELRKHRRFMLLDHLGKEAAFAFDLGPSLEKGDRTALAAQQALSGDVRYLLLRKLPKEEEILEAAESGGELFLMVRQPENRAGVVRIGREGEEYRAFPPVSARVESNRENPPPGRCFFVAGNRALWGNGGELLLFNLADGGSVRRIVDLPGRVTACTLLGGRIYAFFCPNYRQTLLWSCDLEGGDRRLLISNVREEKQNWFDRQTELTAESIWPDPAKNRLIFPAGSGLWELKPETMEHRRLDSFCYSPMEHSQLIGRALYYRSGYGVFARYDFDADRAENFLGLAYDSGGGGKAKYTVNVRNTGFSPPFYYARNHIWFGGFGVKALKLPEVEDSPLLYPPFALHGNRNWVFPHPDGKSVIYAGGRQIFQVTPP